MKIKSKNGFPVSSAVAVFIILLPIFLTAGCQSTSGNTGRKPNYALSSIEAEWIRNGEPIKFEGELWYPADGIEGFLDSEMRLMGTHQGVEFFIDKVDVRPLNRLYTKFGRNKFRYYEKRISE